MHKVHIDLGPPVRSYKTLEEALSACHPFQPLVASAGELLDHARVEGGGWSTRVCDIAFSNGQMLEVEAEDFEVNWRVRSVDDSVLLSPPEPIELVWKSEYSSLFDPCSILSQLSGAEFTGLFVNEAGLLLYTRGNPILSFHAVRNRESGHDFLFLEFGE